MNSQTNGFPVYPDGPILRLPRPGLVVKTIKSRLRKKIALPIEGFQAILKQYPFSIQRVSVLTGGVRSESWLVETDQGRKVLKRYKCTVKRGQIVHEHSILNHLASQNFPGPRVDADQNGSTITEYNDRYFGLFDFLEGYYKITDYLYYPYQTRKLLTTIGKTLGALHLALNNCTPDGTNEYGFNPLYGGRFMEIDWFLEKLEENQGKVNAGAPRGDHPLIYPLMKKVGWISTRLIELDNILKDAHLTHQVIHGDFGPYNLMAREGHPITPIDYELARTDWRMMDIISAFNTSIPNVNKNDAMDRVRWVAQGYQSVNPMAEAEWSLLPYVWEFATLRRIIICWDQYLEQGLEERIQETNRRLNRLKWVSREHEFLKMPAG